MADRNGISQTIDITSPITDNRLAYFSELEGLPLMNMTAEIRKRIKPSGMKIQAAKTESRILSCPSMTIHGERPAKIGRIERNGRLNWDWIDAPIPRAVQMSPVAIKVASIL